MLSHVRRRARALKKRLTPGCLVLCYHRVSDDMGDHWRNAVSVKDFSDHVALLSKQYAIVSIDELADALQRGKPPGFRTVALTFDDGYAVNVRDACEILVKHRASATFYLNTAWLKGELFWWDDLVLALADAEAVHGGDAPLAWLCREAGLPLDGSAPRAAGVDAVRGAFKAMADGSRRELLRRLRAAFQVDARERPDYAPMSAADIKAIVREPRFTIAGHTHGHPSLARLSRDRQRAEIVDNKRRLEEIAGRPVTHFSYPFGAAGDFNDTTIDELLAAGFRTAATTAGTPVRWPGDPFRIPRLSVKNWDARRFDAHVRDAWAH